MTFQPVLPAALLVVIGVLIVAARLIALRRDNPGLLRWSLLTAAVLLVVVAAARPSLDIEDAQAQSPVDDSDLNVFFVVDRSVASRVDDVGDGMTRMAGMRRDITALIDQYPDARFGVITFGTNSDLEWPLSQDAWSLKARIAGMSPYTSTSPTVLAEVNPAAGADILRYEIEQAARAFPRSRNLVFYLGSGAGDARPPDARFSDDAVTAGAVLGYGTVAGGPVARDVVDGQTIFVTDPATGGEIRSGIDEPELTTIADQLGLPYVHRDSGQPVTAAVSGLDAGRLPAAAAAPESRRVELYWAFAVVAALLCLPEIYLTVRQFRRTRVLPQEGPS